MDSDDYVTPAQQAILDQAWATVGECIKAEPPEVVTRIAERLRAIGEHDYLTHMNRIWATIAAIKQEAPHCGARVNDLLVLVAILEPAPRRRRESL
ncbi:MAG: hypothetical protein ACREVE_10495 [Gammaproteobacteria bacterium]